MNVIIFIAIAMSIGAINYSLNARQNKKTFAALKKYMADPEHLRKVVIDNEKGWSECRLHFVGGNTYYYNNVIKYEKEVLLMLESGEVEVLYIRDHVYGIPPINEAYV